MSKFSYSIHNLESSSPGPQVDIERRMKKLEQDLGLINSGGMIAPNARFSRLETLKSKLDAFNNEIREEQQALRDKIKPVLLEQRDSIDGLTFEEIAEPSKQEAKDEEREVLLVETQKRILALRKNLKTVLENIIE